MLYSNFGKENSDKGQYQMFTRAAFGPRAAGPPPPGLLQLDQSYVGIYISVSHNTNKYHKTIT